MSCSPSAADQFDDTRSLRSVNSNSSIASGVSLSRRPRTVRTRSRTVTSRHDKPREDSMPTELPYLDRPLVSDPAETVDGSLTQLSPPVPVRPPRSPQRTSYNLGSPVLAYEDIDKSEGQLATPMAAESSTLHLIMPSPGARTPKGSLYSPGIPLVARTSPSAFSRIPSLPQLNTHVSHVRDSVLTQDSEISQQSGGSSLYPQSSSIVSGPESPPSPRSVAIDRGMDHDVPVVDDFQDYDGDDVSYRLQLLVKNNYFLPPAHSKPSPADLAPLTPNLTKKPTPFLDLFRVGNKSKSKPSTPNSAGGQGYFNYPEPALRTTSDESNATLYSPYLQPRSSTQGPSSPLPGSTPERSGRVVVVREKMTDMASAAKMAEQDLKARGARSSQRGHVNVIDDVIDPTDAVDLPPPSSGYPFAVQASAMRGLGVQDSVGAALLADRLPPAHSSSGMSYDNDGDWRKALLKAAVGHSFDNLHSMSSPVSPNMGSPASVSPSSPISLIGKKIASYPTTDGTTPTSSPMHLKTPTTRVASSHSDRNVEEDCTKLTVDEIPMRVDTPVVPLAPLAPPPRKQLINPVYSLSQTDITGGMGDKSKFYRSTITPPLRSAMSSPMLSDAYESDVRHVLTPPPPSGRHPEEIIRQSYESKGRSIATSDSLYSNDDDDVSVMTTGSKKHQPGINSSPTGSAFNDLYQNGSRSSMSSSPQQYHSMDDPTDNDTTAIVSEAMMDNRPETISPPPRSSSQFALTPLSPPPRSSSLQYKKSPMSPLSDSGYVNSSASPMQPIFAPEPVTPPFPLAERRGNTAPARLSISITTPQSHLIASIQSAPPPSSPASFFDSIQSQPNAMDDLDSSSEEEDSDSENGASNPRDQSPFYVDRRTQTIVRGPRPTPTPTRTTIMRLGNYSSPYIPRPTENAGSLLPIGVSDPRLPIGFAVNPSKSASSSFTKPGWGRKSDQGHGPPISSFDFYTQQRQCIDLSAQPDSRNRNSRRPATSGGEDSRGKGEQDSLKKLDGMLIQHMEAEKERIRQIASSMRSNANVLKG